MSTKAMLFVTCIAAILVSTGVAAAAGPAVTIDYRRSACLQMPDVETGKVRFFVQLVNTSSKKATFAKDIRFVWLRTDGWKDSWLNSIEGGELAAPARGRKRWFADFGADPTKLIIRCALKIGDSNKLHHVKVLR